MININGQSYEGKNITISNGQITVDGINLTPDSKVINITVDGNISNLDVDACQKVTVTGSAGKIKTMSGDVEIGGNVNGDVSSMSGSIECGDIRGNATTMSGNIKHRKN